MIPDLVDFVRAADPDVTAEELADVLWLARFLSGGPTRPGAPGTRPDPPGPGPEPPAPGEPPASPATPPRPPVVPGHAALRVGPAGPGATDAAEGAHTRSPAVAALSDVPALSRALRPLRRKIPSTENTELDEPTTADHIADTGLWLPRTRPEGERWLDLALVVDDSASMVVWERTITEFRAVLGRLGAFRDVRTWKFDGDTARGERTALRGATDSVPHRPRELLDPTGRRLVLVVSDCVGEAWSNGTAAGALAQWAAAGPVAVVQVLPQRLWDDCAPEFVRVRLRGRRPGTPNNRLAARAVDPDDDLTGAGIPVPVLELEPRWFGPWASMVVDPGTGWFTGTALFTGRMDRPRAEPPPAATADEQLRRFRLRASTTAYRLAVYLACAPLSLPVMRLVQHAMLPSSRPAHLAEVFLSGLLRQTAATEDDSDELRFDFQPGVRDELLSELTRHEALQVLSRVSEFVTHRLGSPFDFRALLTDETGDAGSALGPPFAKVARDVLQRLGGRYAEVARRLRVDPTHVDVPAVQAEPGGHDLPERNAGFVGRDDLLDVMRRSLAEGTPLALVGRAGMGKTQLAIEYAHRFRDEYDLVWWVPAEDPAVLRASLADLGARMGVPASADVQRTVNGVVEALRTTRRWLLVFDGAGGPERLRGLLPTGGHVVVTSRSAEWSEQAVVLPVAELTRSDSVALLLGRVSRLTPEEADRVAAVLQDHPLAVRHAAAWLAETDIPVDDYMGLLARQVRASVSGAPWSVTIRALRAHAPDSAVVLDLCAFFADAPIPIEVLASGHDLPVPFGDVLGDPVRLRAALEVLDRVALIRAHFAAGRIQVHGLVQDSVRALSTPAAQAVTAAYARAVLGAANPGEPDESQNWPRYRELAPHIAAANLVGAEEGPARLLLDHIRYLFAIGDYEGSRALGTATADQWRARWGPDDELTLLARRLVANAARETGRVAEAMALDEDTVRRLTEVFGADHEHTLMAAHGLGADLRASGRFDNAVLLDRTNLDRHRRKWGDNHGRTLRAAINLAVDLRLLGDFEGAREIDLDVVRRRREMYGADDPRTLFATANLVRDLLGLGAYDEALRIQESVLPPLRSALGPDHNHVLLATRNLVIALRGTGRYARARAIGEENLAACERRLGPHHEYTLAAMMTLCNVLRRTGELAYAQSLGQRAYSVHMDRDADPWHPFTLAAAINLALVWRDTGKVQLAYELNRATLQASRERRGDDHPHTLACAVNVSSDLSALGDHDRASALSTATLPRMTRVLGDQHPQTLICAFNATLDRIATGSEDGTAEAVAALGRRLGARHPEVVLAAAGRRLACDVEPPPT